MKFVFLGTAEFGLPSLQRLIDSGHTCCGVVTNPPKPSGRGLKLKLSPVQSYCEDHGIGPIFAPEFLTDSSFLSQLTALKADLFVVVAFSILPESLFSIPPQGTYNIHAALLPSFRGPAPIHRAIEQGAKQTGVTLFRIDRGVDTGNILVQIACEISDEDTTLTLYERLSYLGANAVRQGVELIQSGSAVYSEQDHTLATKAPLLKKEEGKINWNQSAEKIRNRIRAFLAFPGTYTEYQGNRLGVEWAEVIDQECSVAPGTIIAVSSAGIEVACESNILLITQIKPAGKRSMSVREYINGCSVQEGTILG